MLQNIPSFSTQSLTNMPLRNMFGRRSRTTRETFVDIPRADQDVFDACFAPEPVDDDLRRKLRHESDVSMVTLLQPAEMLKSEIILHEAARKNSVDRVRKLISEKVDVNSRNNLDRTAVQWAAANGNLQVMEMLISAGADIEAQDKYGMRAVLWAAWFGHTDAVRVLVNNGANITVKNKQGLNMLHCAAQNNHCETVKFIYESLEHFKFDDSDKGGRTPLHLVAEKGHLEALETLLESKCNIQKKDRHGRTAVHIAAEHGHEEVLKKLLLVGIDVDDMDSEGRTALHLAAEHGQAAVIEILLANNADANAETTKDVSPLQMAAQYGHKDVVATLVDYGCDLNAQNYQGNTSLHTAASSNHAHIVRQLIDADVNLDVINQRQQTALHVAVENGLADVVEALLVAGADLQPAEKTGKTALQLASRGSFVGLVDMLIKADRFHDARKGELVSPQPCGDVHHCFYSATCTVVGAGAARPSSKVVQAGESKAIQFKRPAHECTEFMKEILWRLATKQLRQNDWKKLAFHWKFSDAHIKAIEHQYTGPQSYKEHGYRMLLIWLHGVKKEDNPMKFLFEALVAIDRRELAEQIRRRTNVSMDKTASPKFCRMS